MPVDSITVPLTPSGRAMHDVSVDQRRAYIGAHTAPYVKPRVKVTRRPSLETVNTSLTSLLVVLYLTLLSADDMYCSMVAHGWRVMNSGNPVTRRVYNEYQ